ncbi:uncharacterized protein [Watersipora subatra]|uniref:uncharacterized protein n=1 Tax=Watersipora subatra TaxID=2589382 RepID=UPI00355C51DA
MTYQWLVTKLHQKAQLNTAHMKTVHTEHQLVTMSVYELSPGKCKRDRCLLHNVECETACVHGDRLACRQCDTSKETTLCQNSGEKGHKFQKLDLLDEEIAKQFKELLQASSEKLAAILKLDKDMWRSLDVEEGECDDKMELVDQICEEQE